MKITRKVITDNTKVSTLTNTIKTHFRLTVESLLVVGKCLHEIREILERKAYLEHLKRHFSMSEMQAHRIEKLYLHFNTKASAHVLSSKPSVLYLLISNTDPKKIHALAKGGKVLIGNKYKRLEELSVKDIAQIGKSSPERKAFNVDEDELDLEKSKNAHRRLATLVEELTDWTNDLRRYDSQKLKIQNRHLIKQYAEETIECLKDLIQIL